MYTSHYAKIKSLRFIRIKDQNNKKKQKQMTQKEKLVSQFI